MSLGRKIRDPLEHEGRWRLLELVRHRPGVAFLQLRDATGMANGEIQFHMDVLHRFGLIFHRKSGRHRRYYATGRIHAWWASLDALLHVPSCRAIAEQVQGQPGIHTSALAYLTGHSRANVDHFTRKLTLVGALRMVPGPRRMKRWYATDRLTYASTAAPPSSSPVAPALWAPVGVEA